MGTSIFIFIMVTEEGNKRREASKAKYGPVLEEIFVDIDVDKSGYASIDEMCSHMTNTKQVALGSRSLQDFQNSMKHYLTHFNYACERPNELNLSEFVSF